MICNERIYCEIKEQLNTVYSIVENPQSPPDNYTELKINIKNKQDKMDHTKIEIKENALITHY